MHEDCIMCKYYATKAEQRVSFDTVYRLTYFRDSIETISKLRIFFQNYDYEPMTVNGSFNKNCDFLKNC